MNDSNHEKKNCDSFRNETENESLAVKNLVASHDSDHIENDGKINKYVIIILLPLLFWSLTHFHGKLHFRSLLNKFKLGLDLALMIKFLFHILKEKRVCTFIFFLRFLFFFLILNLHCPMVAIGLMRFTCKVQK